MTNEEIACIGYIEAVDLHFALMKLWGASRFGVESRDLIESALARPKHAAVYEDADLIRQAASLVADRWKIDEIENWLRGRAAERQNS